MPETKKYLIFFLAAAIVGLLGLAQFPPSGGFVGQVGGLTVNSTEDFPVVPDLHVVKTPVAKGIPTELELSARAVLVKDLHSGAILYEKNFREVFPIASLTKLMTAVLVVERLPIRKTVEIAEADVDTLPYTVNLVAGEKLPVFDLLSAMLINSANDATLALAREALGSVPEFVEAMNMKAQSLGMEKTKFTNPIGFDDPGNYATAEDLAILVKEFLSYPILSEIVSRKTAVISSVDGQYQHELRTTNRLLETYPEVAGIKTGYTTDAIGNLIILVKSPETSGLELGPYYSIILGSPERESETEKIMQWVKENFAWTP